MFNKNKKQQQICRTCGAYNKAKGECRVAILYGGTEFHMPVAAEDKCHMLELGIPVDQVRWFVEDEDGNPSKTGKVKIEYPENFFGDKTQ